MKVKDIMVSDTLRYCDLDTKLNMAAKYMDESNCGALPIVDDEKKVIGMVSDRDICLSLAQMNGESPGEMHVKDIISDRNVKTVNVEDDVSEALHEMRVNRVGRLPVTDSNGKLAGILSFHNLLSRSLNKENYLGNVDSTDENLARVLTSLSDRVVENINKISIKSGIYSGIGLIAYFFAMRFFNLQENLQLHYFNILIVFTGLWYTLSHSKRVNGSIKYLDGLRAGVLTSFISITMLSLFLISYSFFGDSTFFDLLKEKVFHAHTLSHFDYAVQLTGILMMEGISSAVIGSFILMQYYKSEDSEIE